jgi:hypothetical protein
MGIIETMSAGGYKPKLSTDGIWEPYKGTYKVKWEVCRLETDQKNGNVQYIQAEWNILETLEGDPKRESKYADFKKRYYIEGEKAEKNWQKFKDDAFTFGVDVSSQDDFAKLIGIEGYMRAWSWTPEGKEPTQSISIVQQKVAEKKRSKDSLAF